MSNADPVQIVARGPRAEAEAAARAIDADTLLEGATYSILEEDEDRGLWRIDAYPTRYRLVYPRGQHNAESLLRDRQGRLYVITKSFLGGAVYRAPLHLSSSRPNHLQRTGRVTE